MTLIAGIKVLLTVKHKCGFQLFELTQPHQANQVEPELGTAQAQLLILYSHFKD